MIITISKSILENILLHAGPFLEKKDTSQITSHIYLNANNNSLTLKATDYEIGFCVIVNNVYNKFDLIKFFLLINTHV